MNHDDDLRNALDIELAKPRGGYDDKPPDACFSGGWIQELKLDGYRKTLQFGETKNWLASRSRHNKMKGVAVSKKTPFISSCTEVPWLSGLIRKELAGTVLDGELVVDTSEHAVVGATMVGHLAVESPEKLKYSVFDVLFCKGEDLRAWPLMSRRDLLTKIVTGLGVPKIQMVQGMPASRLDAERLFAEGAEGVVLKSLSSKYLPRHGCGWWKWKAEISVDAVIIGVSEAKAGGSPKNGIKPKPTGKASMFKVAMFKDGKLTPVGWAGALPEAVAESGLSEFKEKFLGRVIEFTASGFDGRWFGFGRFRQFRDDKTGPECLWDEQVGGLKVQTEVEAEV